MTNFRLVQTDNILSTYHKILSFKIPSKDGVLKLCGGRTNAKNQLSLLNPLCFLPFPKVQSSSVFCPSQRFNLKAAFILLPEILLI